MQFTVPKNNRRLINKATNNGVEWNGRNSDGDDVGTVSSFGPKTLSILKNALQAVGGKILDPLPSFAGKTMEIKGTVTGTTRSTTLGSSGCTCTAHSPSSAGKICERCGGTIPLAAQGGQHAPSKAEGVSEIRRRFQEAGEDKLWRDDYDTLPIVTVISRLGVVNRPILNPIIEWLKATVNAVGASGAAKTTPNPKESENGAVNASPVAVAGKETDDVNPKWKLSEKIAAAKASKDSLDTAPHVVVTALAGTGKTTTLVEGLKRVKGLISPLIPSPQQKAVWDSMALSAGKVQTIAFVAFNKSVKEELANRVPAGCEAMTMHGLGAKAVNKAFKGSDGKGPRLNEYRVQDIIALLVGKDIREIRKADPILVQATEKLVALCKQNLIGVGKAENPTDSIEDELDKLVSHYEVELDRYRTQVYDLVPKVLERCLNVDQDRCIDFNDMIWLPIAANLPMYRYDLLLVDEAQDLNRCQQALALKSGRRLVLCGDVNQAIYGFAGADADSLPRMERTLAATDKGCVTLPLTVTRRCGKAIVEEAKKIVPTFEAFVSNPEGKISRAAFDGVPFPTATTNDDGSRDGVEQSRTGYRYQVLDGDFILCRVNAPLVSQCFKFLREGRKANIQGRDIGQGLISTINKLMKKAIPEGVPEIVELMTRIGNWAEDEVRKLLSQKNPNEQRIIAVQDRKECLLAFCEEAKTVYDVTSKVERIFTDNSTGGIRLSSIHKAKGLEAKRVFFLMPKGAECPHPMAKSAWQKGQELNLKYVAVTRAIEELIYVS